jgi:AbrB family looped-hinge helix DNA binding protein
MQISTLTVKGQTTIPKTVRDSLHLKPKDKLFYVVEGDTMIVRPVHGDIRQLKGIFKGAVKGPINFRKLREETKQMVTREILEEMR